MISLHSHATGSASDRYHVMLAHLSLGRSSSNGRSLLYRVLDGRDLEEVCPVDLAMLSPEERAHYRATLRDPKSLALAVRARAELRRMLARETGVPPHQVPLRNDAHGKPRCPHASMVNLDFSVAHAQGCAVIALGEADGLGVDVEEVEAKAPSDENLEIVFNDHEHLAWAHLPADNRSRAFSEAWTIKEAALKALGTGLDGSPHDIEVHFDASGHAWPAFPSAFWVFQRIDVCPRYAASFVALLPGGDLPLPGKQPSY